MKAICYILSLCILILTAIPCADVPEDNAVRKVELSQNATDHQHNDADSCSPFCTCNCCASPVLHQANNLQFKCFSLEQKELFVNYSAHFPTISTSVWQPPKIG